MAKSQTHRFFANALQYSELFPKLEAYARLAMVEHEWYDDTEEEKNCVPGTYAVFGLGLTDKQYFPLVGTYMSLVDQEHQYVQQSFTLALIQHYGIDTTTLPTSDALLQSIIIQPSDEAHNNIAVANYHLGQLQEASDYFLLSSKRSDYAMYSHVKCLIELGRKEEAKNKLDTFSENDDEFVGTVEIAELFLELGYFEESVQWFEQGWQTYWKTPDWVSRYVYALFKINNPNRVRDIIKEVIQQLLDEKNEYEIMYEQISSGYTPSMKYNTSMSTSCYLFGCKRHNHPEYKE
ncbi:DUF6138 family protein [Paenibacillus glacialis]|uniref:Uncharacterized protein n=1 Tax=Paenibacillus glacialis TaxID=494026 RepID=A0A162MH91_9BACL|nr:hypothetical protein PGLA_04565 [Paenibacillus glacialis]